MTALPSSGERPSGAYRALAVTALVVSVVPALVLVIGSPIASSLPGEEPLGAAVVILVAFLVATIVVFVLLIAAIVLCRPRMLPLVGMGILVVTIVVVLFLTYAPFVRGA